MKASKFSDAQKAFILKQGNDGVPVAEITLKRIRRGAFKRVAELISAIIEAGVEPAKTSQGEERGRSAGGAPIPTPCSRPVPQMS
jgi:hypothetical protein